MPQWEYRKIDLNDVPPKTDEIDVLNHAGADGWEVLLAPYCEGGIPMSRTSSVSWG